MENKKINLTEFIIGAVLLVLLIVLNRVLLKSDMLLFRMVIGLAIGYVLTRAAFGFAGGVNRAYKTGSTKLMRAIMLAFFISSVITAGVMFKGGDALKGLWVNPINFALFIGALMFGIGMAMTMCCASGLLTDMADGTSRALITLFFFGLGRVVGNPLGKLPMSSAKWIQSSENFSGVYFPDLFKFDGANGYIGAVLLTALLCLAVVALAKAYENKRKANNTYYGVMSEKLQNEAILETVENKAHGVFSVETFKKIFVNPFSLATGAILMAVIYGLLLNVTGGGWGVSGPFGNWIGRILALFVGAGTIESAFGVSAASLTSPFFTNGMNLQDLGIIAGAVIALLLSGKFVAAFKSGLKINLKQGLMFAIGGFIMGVGTILAKGCNAGGMFTPISNFSLSGWIFLAMMVVGGTLGNIIKEKVFKD